jgi:acetate kinase
VILVLNAGSSSVKFSLYREAGARPPALVSHGAVEGIGTAPRFIFHAAPAEAAPTEVRNLDSNQDFDELLGELLRWVEDHLGAYRLKAVGHRVVHGGVRHSGPELITAALLSELDRLAPLAPLHQPHNLAPIRAIASVRPGLPQVACFDTAFHHGIASVATRFALPREYETAGVRRYGFHGLSYEYISRQLPHIRPRLAKGRTIAAHLGNGASLCAMAHGRSVDTTMGFTALDGLVMGTRCGNIDPGVVLYLAQEGGLTTAQIEDLLYHRSGLLGVSGGIASDMRVLLDSASPLAQEAVELFVFRVAREAGALVSTLGGLDGLVFTAGIGENSPAIRSLVCKRLAWLGVRLNPAANSRNETVISARDSAVEVLVVPTDEGAMIARHTYGAIRAPTLA